MALNDLVMPKLGLTMTEGVLSEWQVAAGDKVRAGQILFVVETDKLATEVEATGEGEIVELVAEPGATLPVGATVARWTGQSGGDAQETPAAPQPDHVPAPVVDPTPRPAAAPAAVAHANGSKRIVASPLARRKAQIHNIDLASIRGSGASGRIKARDIGAPGTSVAQPSPPASAPAAGGRIAPTPLQATVARRLTAAKRDIPHFYLSTEADVGALADLRSALNADDRQAKLSVNHFILAAVARAWAEQPNANRVWQDDAFVALPSVDVGMAVDTPRGLLAPVIRGAGELSLDGIAAAAGEVVARARDGRLTGDDMAGGAVTVSNVGMFGVTYLTPIINPGQSAILGVGAVRELFRPDARGQPALKREIGLVLACDHRVFNGVDAAKLLGAIVDYLEQPARLLRRG